MASIANYVIDELEIQAVNGKTILRQGWRSRLKRRDSQNQELSFHVGGQIPYFYRDPQKIGKDFAARHNALDMVADLGTKGRNNTEVSKQSLRGNLERSFR